MPQNWFIESHGRSTGPYSPRRLQDLATTGQLEEVDRVSLDGKRWVAASKVKGLQFPNGSRELLDTKSAVIVANKLPDQSNSISIPGYQIESELGAGACGVVYRAKQKSLNRVVALKVVDIPANRSSAYERFQQEAQLLAKLDHPNIVPVFDTGRQSSQVFMAMALLEGEDLESQIQRLGQLDEQTAWHIARQTALALAHAAKHGIIHRDVKPANLFLTSPAADQPQNRPIVKVTDFGLAYTRSIADDQRITQQGAVVGTPAYMAPEQFAHRDVTLQADIYALGATVFHAISGKTPYTGNTIWDVMVKKNESAPKLTGVHIQSAKLVADMMHPNPLKRISDYVELLRRIDELPFLQNTASQSIPQPSQRLGKKKAIIGSTIATLMVLIVGFSFVRSGSEFVSSPPAKFHSNGRPEVLSDRVNMPSWLIDGTIRFEADSEGNNVLEASGKVSWVYRPTNTDRLSLGIDLHRSESVDVGFAPRGKDGDWFSLRLSRTEGIQIGVLKPDASFTKLSPVTTFPKDREQDGLVPYLSVEFQHAGNRWDVWVDGQHLGGIHSQSTKMPEIQIRTDGRAVRIERVELERLHPSN